MAKSYKVFYFEDDLKEGQEIKKFLEKEPERPGDPHLEVTHHLTAGIAFDVIKQRSGHPPDVALLDVHQENYSGAGHDISDEIKKTWPRVPVVMLSQLESLAEQKEGYEHGASTYLPRSIRGKPDHQEFIRTVLLAQIWNAERTDTSQGAYWNGSLKVDKKIYKVYWDEKEVTLSPTDVDIVDALANPKQRGGVCGFQELITKGRVTSPKNKKGEDYYEDEEDKRKEDRLKNNLSKRIKNIREAFTKVDENFETADYGIVSVHGVGYRWQTDNIRA